MNHLSFRPNNLCNIKLILTALMMLLRIRTHVLKLIEMLSAVDLISCVLLSKINRI